VDCSTPDGAAAGPSVREVCRAACRVRISSSAALAAAARAASDASSSAVSLAVPHCQQTESGQQGRHTPGHVGVTGTETLGGACGRGLHRTQRSRMPRSRRVLLRLGSAATESISRHTKRIAQR
jgi:hypothetical protein